MNKKLKIVSLIVLCAAPSWLDARYFGINVFRPWDINLRPDEWCGAPLQLTGYYEHGFRVKGFDADNHNVNVAQIWTPTQNALAMLQGFPANSPETDYLDTFLPGVTDDGIRGHFSVAGDFEMPVDAGFCGRYHWNNGIILGVFLPVMAMQLKNVQYADLTPDATAEDILVQQNLMNNFFSVVNTMDPSLTLTGWKRAGVGDLAIVTEWLRYFPQQKEYLKNVGVNIRVGVTLPTGVRQNINDILSVPFGFDGAFSLFGGAGIILNWFDCIRGGIDFEFLNIFGMTRDMRIKIQDQQTDFLFLQKARAFTEYGFTQRYNLFLEAYRVTGGLSFGGAYQFYKHGTDTLQLTNETYSTAIANTAQNLKEWSINQFLVWVKYDFQCDLDDCAALKPQLQFFCKLPVSGKRAILVSTVGVALSLNF